MSEISEQLRASVLLADYAAQDGNGRLSVVGGGLQFVGFEPATGLSAPFAVLVILQSVVPLSEPVAIEIVLADASGQAVELPGPAGPQLMRVAQNVEFLAPALPGVTLPKGSVNSQAVVNMYFPTGLPLTPGLSYSWRVQADHEVLITQPFFVPGPAQGPVIG